jgi:hypothetical protein
MTPPSALTAALSRADDVVAVVDASQEHVTKVDGPDPVVDCLEAEELLLERVGDEEQTRLESERPRIRHALGNVVGRVLDRRQQ